MLINVVFITALCIPVICVQHRPLHCVVSVRVDDGYGVHIAQYIVHRQLINDRRGGGECVQTGVAVRALCAV